MKSIVDNNDDDERLFLLVRWEFEGGLWIQTLFLKESKHGMSFKWINYTVGVSFI